MRIATTSDIGHWSRNDRVFAGNFLAQKASQSLPPAGGKNFQIIFHRDMCVGKNTYQAASVEFCRLRQNYARSRLQTPLAENSYGIFCQ